MIIYIFILIISTVDNKECTTPGGNKGIYSGDWCNNNPNGTGK
jgi:hypothetical protein